MTQTRHLGKWWRWTCGVALLALLVTLALVPGATPVSASTVTVHMINNTFQKQDITVRVGTTIKWINDDQAEIHDIINPDGVFGTGDLYYSGTYQWTFTQVGAYDYYCYYHNGMVGTITVLEAFATATPTRTPMPEPTRHTNAVPTVTLTSAPIPPTHAAVPTPVSVPPPRAQPVRH